MPEPISRIRSDGPISALRDEKIEQVQVDQEILAQVVPRPQPMASQKIADVSSRLAYDLFHFPCWIVLKYFWTYLPRMSVSRFTLSPG